MIEILNQRVEVWKILGRDEAGMLVVQLSWCQQIRCNTK